MLERPYGVVVRQGTPGSSLWRYILAAREESKEPARTAALRKAGRCGRDMCRTYGAGAFLFPLSQRWHAGLTRGAPTALPFAKPSGWIPKEFTKTGPPSSQCARTFCEERCVW